MTFAWKAKENDDQAIHFMPGRLYKLGMDFFFLLSFFIVVFNFFYFLNHEIENIQGLLVAC